MFFYNYSERKVIMKKRLIIILIVLLVIAFPTFFLSKNVLVLPICYKNSSLLDKKTNNEIKSLLLKAMKDQCSTLYNMDKKELFTEDCIQGDLDGARFRGEGRSSWFITIDDNFMKNLIEKSDNEYVTVIKVNWPNEDNYHFNIKLIDGKYMITAMGIDP